MLSCNQNAQRLQVGDILFQNLDCGDLCNAIEAVTYGVDGKDFSHCAMVIKVNDTLKVIEAIGNKVQINSVDTFFKRSGDNITIKNITVGRLKASFASLIPKATANAIEKIGQPYDNVFLLNNGAWYCSELLYDAFKKANNNHDFFQLYPMTYKDPKTKSFFPAWVSYYKNLNTEIPEGKLGLNPGSISRSKNIEIIKLTTVKWQILPKRNCP